MMAISHIIIAAMVGVYSDNWPAHQTQGWVSAAFLLVYMIAFGASWGPVPWALPSEIFPSSLRAKGVALSTCSNWLNNFIIVSSLPINQQYIFPNYIGCFDANIILTMFNTGPDHTPTSPRHRLRRLRILRSFLHSRWYLDIFLCSRDNGSNTRTNGSCFQG